MAALLANLAKGDKLPDRCVLVVDEVGMVPTRELAELLDRVNRAAGKLVLVGDDRQLPSIDAGGAFRGLIQRGLAVEPGENVRQANVWERQALDHLRRNCYYLLGETCSRLGDDDAADEHFRKLGEFYPQLPFLSEFLRQYDISAMINLKEFA